MEFLNRFGKLVEISDPENLLIFVILLLFNKFLKQTTADSDSQITEASEDDLFCDLLICRF